MGYLVTKRDFSGKSFQLTLPSSKSLANRALILAAHSKGETHLRGDFEAEDIQVMIDALKKLSILVEETDEGLKIENNLAWRKLDTDIAFFMAGSGTSTRFLASLMPLRTGASLLIGIPRMHERPIGDLVDALRSMGAEIVYREKEGFPPLEFHGTGSFTGGKCSVKGNTSSQFLSSLMLSASSYEQGLEISMEGELISRPYVEITKQMINDWGGDCIWEDDKIIIKPIHLQGKDFTIEGDASAATYWWALEFLHDCSVTFSNLTAKSLQGDIKFKDLLKRLKDHKDPKSLTLDMIDMPDASLALMAIAPLLDHPIKVTGIGSLRVKETDRIEAMAAELRKLRVDLEVGEDWMQIHPLDMSAYDSKKTIQIETYNDHRIAMSFAILSTVLGNLEILDPDCVNKTYPNFWKDLESLS